MHEAAAGAGAAGAGGQKMNMGSHNYLVNADGIKIKAASLDFGSLEHNQRFNVTMNATTTLPSNSGTRPTF
jgi:hypothetical protein